MDRVADFLQRSERKTFKMERPDGGGELQELPQFLSDMLPAWLPDYADLQHINIFMRDPRKVRCYFVPTVP